MKQADTKIMKIMLVDDEPIMLTKLKTLMDYRQYGFEICGETSNGKGAIGLLETLRPDILFTDMRMPAMDGVELINYLKTNYPRIKVITISGYEDFQYVYQSLQSGAVDYLLKHQLDPGRMKQVLAKVRSQIEQEQDTSRWENDVQVRLSEADKIVRTENLRRYLTGEAPLTEAQKKEFSMRFPTFYMMLIEVDKLGQPGKSDEIMEDIIEKICSESAVSSVVHLSEGRYLVFLTFAKIVSEQKHHDLIYDSMRRCQNSAQRFVNKTLSCCRSGLLTGPDQAKLQYQRLIRVLDTKFYAGEGQILEFSGRPGADKPFNFPDDCCEDRDWMEMLRPRIFEYFDYARETKMPSEQLKEFSCQILQRLLKAGRKWGISEAELPAVDFASAGSFVELKSVMKELLAYVQAAFSFLPETGQHSPKVKEALEFIHQNFITPISLDTVSQVIGLNGAYLSRIFKEETGKGMTEYTKELRIQKARILLENSSYSIKNICNMCGFNDYGYFIRSFKAITGESPVQYRQKKSK